MDIQFFCNVATSVIILGIFVVAIYELYSLKIKIETKIYTTLLVFISILLICLCLIIRDKELSVRPSISLECNK